MIRSICLAIGLGLLIAAAARADVFLLTGGGTVEGELLNPEQEPRMSFVVKTGGGTITLGKAQVTRHVPSTPAEMQYKKHLATLDGMAPSAEPHWQLAEWCKRNGLNKQREFHLQRVLEFDPGHEGARHGLGFSRVDDRWVRMDDYMRKRGFVRDGTSWKLPHELAVAEREREVELAQKDWAVKLKRWRGWLGNSKRHADAVANIQGIRDPLASQALADLLETEENREMRLMYVDVLGELATGTANTALVKASLEDSEDSVRDRAFRTMQETAPRSAAATYLRALSEDDYKRLNLAAIYLGRLGEQRAIPKLIDALTTKRKVTAPPSGGGRGLPISTGFSGNGGISFNPGASSPQTTEVDWPNEGVLQALAALTQVNHQYDADRWREWYEMEATPRGVDLRRRND